jgi:hypothetical protein
MNDSHYERIIPNVISNEPEEGEIYSPRSQTNTKQPYHNH